MQQGIKKLQWYEYLKLVFLEILNPLLCRVFANQVTNKCAVNRNRQYMELFISHITTIERFDSLLV